MVGGPCVAVCLGGCPGLPLQRPWAALSGKSSLPGSASPFPLLCLGSSSSPAVADFEPWDSSSLDCTFWTDKSAFSDGQIVLYLEKYSYRMFYSTEPSRVKCSLMHREELMIGRYRVGKLFILGPWGSWRAEWKTNKSFVVVLAVTSNYFGRFCDKRQHLLDVCTPPLDAGAAVCLVHGQRQVCAKFISLKGNDFF